MKNKEIDYIILGGGCSALSFALELNNNNIYNYSFLIIESRARYEDDRSWCFWQNKENTFVVSSKDVLNPNEDGA